MGVATGSHRRYVPALAERLARERLKAAAQSAGTLAKDAPVVLFLALHDTGRGQMGASLMQTLAGKRVSVHSLEPAPVAARSTQAS